ncbi:cupin domain-containing protein [Longibaculum muris]|uniref:cupin domain-containing protein n=1 Tax=Longibaculum muris TaxID=1796628 RepID=UPI003AB5F086
MYSYYDLNDYNDYQMRAQSQVTNDFGPNPFVIDIEKATMNNDDFRVALWTGPHLQLTVMSIPVGESIGLEIHPQVDQFLHIEDGTGIAMMGDKKDNLYLQQPVFEGSAIFIPAGMWHNVVNTGNKPLKLYSIYAPADHPWGTVHPTKADAQAQEHH